MKNKRTKLYILLACFISFALGGILIDIKYYLEDIELAQSHKMKLCYYAGQNIFPVYKCTTVSRGAGF